MYDTTHKELEQSTKTAKVLNFLFFDFQIRGIMLLVAGGYVILSIMGMIIIDPPKADDITAYTMNKIHCDKWETNSKTNTITCWSKK